jgi:hypothetical protein
VTVRGWWVLAVLLVPFGLGSGPAFWYAAWRAGGVRAWTRAGALWFAAALAGYLVALAMKDTDPIPHAAGLAVMLAAWAGASIHALLIRPEYVRRAAPLAAAAQRRANAAERRRIVREEPRLARELRSGTLPSAMADLERADDVKPWWVLLTAVPLGFGVGPGFLYAAIRARSVAYAIYGAVWLAVCLAGLVLTLVYPEDSNGDQFGSFLMVMTWFVGCGQAFALRNQYVRRVRARDASPIVRARERLEQRDEARRIAARDPRLALEMGIGRPDRGTAGDGGLIDVNHVPEKVLLRLPGVDRELARRIVTTRREVRGFSSLEDMGTVLDLPPDLVEEMRELALFLPRG